MTKQNLVLSLSVAILIAVVMVVMLFVRDFRQQDTQDQFREGASRTIVENFALYDQDVKYQELYYRSDMKVVVIVSQGNSCPIVRKSIPYLNHLQEQYESRGVFFLMINASQQDTRPAIKSEADSFNISMPILKDQAQVIAKSLGLTRTAEAIVLDTGDWSGVYRGAIHDGIGYESDKGSIEHHYLRDAINAHLNNHVVLADTTDVKGCLINLDQEDEQTGYTYARDVVPILNKHCVDCHSICGAAPWSMDGYKRVKGWGPMIREVVRPKRMPPWHADPAYGRFQEDNSLSAEEEKILIGWVEQGFARGQGNDPLVKKGQASSAFWGLGEPDLKFRLKTSQSVTATGEDEFRMIEGDRPIDRDIWVKAIDIRPGNPKVVHHGNLSVVWPDNSGTVDNPATGESTDRNRWLAMGGMSMEKGSMIAAYAPGNRVLQLPQDTGVFLPKGSRLLFEMHYITTGKPETDLTEVGFYLLDEKPTKILSVSTINNRNIKIPAGEKNYKRRGNISAHNDLLLTALQPHMHYRGKSMKFIIEYPDGSSEIALSVPNYRFKWQRRYTFAEPKFLPRGTTIHLEGLYDNSSQNPDNPDPEQEVVYGPYSHTEMFQGIAFYINQNSGRAAN